MPSKRSVSDTGLSRFTGSKQFSSKGGAARLEALFNMSKSATKAAANAAITDRRMHAAGKSCRDPRVPRALQCMVGSGDSC